MTGDIEDLCTYVPIVGYSRYEILNIHPYTVRNRATGRVLKPTLHATGYYQHSLINDDGVRKQYVLHRLIAVMFIPNPHEYACVDHVNRDKTDNRLMNLRWTTHSVNNRNIPQKKGVVYTWIDTPPDDTTPAGVYNDWQFNRLYYSRSTDTFYTECMGQYRELIVHTNPRGVRYVNMKNTSGKVRAIYINKYKRQNGIPV